MAERYLSDSVPDEQPTHEHTQQLVEAESGKGAQGIHRVWQASDSDKVVLISDTGGVKISRDNGATSPQQVVVDGTTAGGVLSGTFPSPGFAGSPTFTGPVTVNGALTVTGHTTLNTVTVGGNASVNGALTVALNATVGGTLGVTGHTTLSTVGVSSNATVGGTLGVTGHTTLATVTVGSNAAVNGALGVTGHTTLSTLTVTSNATVNGSHTVGGALYVTGLSTVATLDVTGDLHLTGSATLGDALTDTVQIPGTLLVVDDAEFRADLVHKGSFLGLFNTAPTTKQTVTGSRGGNVALASLCTALAAYGLIVNSTS